MFIHHSVGLNWLNDGLHDALLAKEYVNERNDIYYGTVVEPDPDRPPSLGAFPGDNTFMNHWLMWFNDYLGSVRQFECSDGFNCVIMFKCCFPASNIVSDGFEPGDPFAYRTIANYKAVYRHFYGPGTTYLRDGYIYYPLEDIFAANPDILFIPVTAPPRHYAPEDATTDEEAHRARVFNNWLKNEWLPGYYEANPGLYNVAVFDLFDALTYPDDHPEHPNRLRAEYGGESGNSHPNTAANIVLTESFALNPDNFIDLSWALFVYGPLQGIGDLNCDSVVNPGDIYPFALALGNPAVYEAAYPDCDINHADTNDDGVRNAFDIDPFIDLLLGQ